MLLGGWLLADGLISHAVSAGVAPPQAAVTPPLTSTSADTPAAPAAPSGPPSPGKPAAMPAGVPQIARDGWKDCTYNERIIRCRDEPVEGGLRIIWIDGPRNTYRPRAAARGEAEVWVDRQGGLWRHELLAQGNTVLSAIGGGQRIVVPLRFPCRPPLRGEVGYCHP